jgi:hypothetical protein
MGERAVRDEDEDDVVTFGWFKKNVMTNTSLRQRRESSPNKSESDIVASGGKSEAAGLILVDHAVRSRNRALPTGEVLEMLRATAPAIYARAEIVGRWVWVAFESPQSRQTTAMLSQFGFHWNNTRQTWQHPCGVKSEGTGADPRAKYGSCHASEFQPC